MSDNDNGWGGQTKKKQLTKSKLKRRSETH